MPQFKGMVRLPPRVSTPGTITRVPNQPKTRTRTFRIPDALYESAQQAAEANGETVTDVVKRALERYVKAAERKS